MFLLLLYGILALGISFFCPLLEAVLLSLSPSFVANLEDAGHPAGPLLRRQKEHIHRPLAAILTLNTASHTVGAAGVGAQAQVLWGSEVLAVTSGILTLLILLLSEVIPKVLGAAYCNRLAPWAARTLVMMVWLLYPFVLLSEAITGRVKKNDEEVAIDRKQIAALARLGLERGMIEPAESRMIVSITRAGEVRIKDVMTPRTVIFSLALAASVREAMEQKLFPRFSRIPVYRNREDDIVGYVLKDELLLQAAKDQLDVPISQFLRPVLFVPESQLIVETFEHLLERREHLALAVDEYGSVAGIASMEDIVETILGCEIVDEADGVRDTRVLARHKWVDRARRLGIAAEHEIHQGA